MALEEQVVDRLIHLGYTVSFAESCTGGLCCGTLVNVANASKVCLLYTSPSPRDA